MDLKVLSASVLLALRGVPGQPCTVDLADEKSCWRERGRIIGRRPKLGTNPDGGDKSFQRPVRPGATLGRLLEAGMAWEIGYCGDFFDAFRVGMIGFYRGFLAKNCTCNRCM